MVRRGGEQRIPRPPTFRPGPPAPWADLAPAARRIALGDVEERLARLPPARPGRALVEGSRAAAVLIPLFEEAGETRVVLTKRPDTMPSHSGEIAFPGGKHDPHLDADLRATALRETEEEIGLEPAAIEVLAQLDGLATVATRFVVTPFVGVLRHRPLLTPHPWEVAAVFDVALSELMDPDAYHGERWDVWKEDLDVHFYDLPGETIWGATARILTSFLGLLVAGSGSGEGAAGGGGAQPRSGAGGR